MLKTAYVNEMTPRNCSYKVYKVDEVSTEFDNSLEILRMESFTSLVDDFLKNFSIESLKAINSSIYRKEEEGALFISPLDYKNITIRLVQNNFEEEFSKKTLLKIENIGWKADILHELEELFQDCKEKNWDGYGASGVSELSYEDAKKLINLLPESENILAPELDPLPTGEISLYWSISSNINFSLTFSDNEILGIFIERDGKNTKTLINKSNDLTRLSYEIKQILIKNFTKN